MADKSAEVEIVLGGQKEVLRPTFYAAQTLSRAGGGFIEVTRKLLSLDFDTAVQVITLGLGYGPSQRRAPTDLAQRIWETGLTDDSGGLVAQCVTYVRILANGGRPLPEGETEGTVENPP